MKSNPNRVAFFYFKNKGQVILTMVTIRQNLLNSGKYSIKSPNLMTPKYITIHNTYNDASANNEALYHNRNDNQVSFHYAVDDVEIVQVIPDNRNAWHCGDGRGNGNMKSIGIEICYSKSGGAKYVKAEENAVQLTAYLLKKHGLKVVDIRQHYDWSGKNCPHRIRDNGTWKNFLGRVQVALDALNGVKPTKTSSTTKETYRIKSGTFNTKAEVSNALDKAVSKNLVSKVYATVHEDKGKFYFQTGTYADKAVAERYLRLMKEQKILWVGSVIKA